LRLVFGIEEGTLMNEGRKIMDELSHASNPLIVFVSQLQRSWFHPGDAMPAPRSALAIGSAAFWQNAARKVEKQTM